MLKAGPAACWLWVCGIAHCQSQLTDGFISRNALPMIGVAGGTRVTRLAEILVNARLFDRGEDGYWVHDYLDHNPSRAFVLAKRAEDAARKRPEPVRIPVGIPKESNAPRARVPSHPIPSHPIREEDHDRACDDDFERFKQAYPANRRQGGAQVEQAFLRALERTTLEDMLSALEQQRRSEQWQTPKLIPLMTTWLHQQRWAQVLPEPQGFGATPQTAGNAAALQRFAAKGAV